MSEYCENPDINYPRYNAGEIRLYGRLAIEPMLDNIVLPKISFTKFFKTPPAEMTPIQWNALQKELIAIEKSQDKIAGEVVSIGIRKGKTRYGISVFDQETMAEMQSIGIIYGYAFEGHCYKLPKPTLMVLPVAPLAKFVDGDCGYDSKLGYSAWAIDKLARVVILDIRTDTVKALVLDENTPGNRSPLAYSQHQALAPQRNRE